LGRVWRLASGSGAELVFAAAMRVDIRLYDVHSLKEKRGIVKKVMSQVARTYPVSVAEVDHQDLWQRSALGVAVAAAHPGQLDRILHAVERDLRERSDVEVLSIAVSHLEEPM
jgi:hypothetical protein